MDVHDKLDDLTALVESARAMPMSASCIVNRAEVLALLDDLRELLPEEFRHAELLLQDREAVVEEGRREAQRVIEEAEVEHVRLRSEAEVEHGRLVSETEVLTEATRQADELRRAAEDEAASMRREVDDYVDAKLATFEVTLNKTLAAVHRGREKLRGRTETDALGTELAEDAPPASLA